MCKKRKSLGRNIFEIAPAGEKSQAVQRLITGRSAEPSDEEASIDVQISLSPSDLEHLDTLSAKLKEVGKGSFSRDELVRISIALLSFSDF